jgi:hypothetical protein
VSVLVKRGTIAEPTRRGKGPKTLTGPSAALDAPTLEIDQRSDPAATQEIAVGNHSIVPLRAG